MHGTEIWVFGGEGRFAAGRHRGQCRTSFSNLYCFDVTTGAWRVLRVGGKHLPQARRGHSTTRVDAPEGTRLVVFGGTARTDAFSLQESRWKQACIP